MTRMNGQLDAAADRRLASFAPAAERGDMRLRALGFAVALFAVPLDGEAQTSDKITAVTESARPAAELRESG